MAWGAQHWIRATPETTYGVYDATQAANAIWFRLAGDTAFSMQNDPLQKQLMSADGNNRRVQQISSRREIKGKLRTPAYPSQLAAILGWAVTLASNDLSSYTLDRFDSVVVERFLGAKVGKAQLQCASETDEGLLWLDLDLQAQAPGTPPTLTQPAFSVFPTENPYVHKESKAGFSFGGSIRVAYNKFSATITNILSADFEEDQYINNLTFCGRTVDYSSDFQYTSTTDQTAYEGQTANAASIAFTRVGTPNKVLTLNFEGQSRIVKRTRTLPLGKVSRQVLDFMAFFDGGAGTDFAFTQT